MFLQQLVDFITYTNPCGMPKSRVIVCPQVSLYLRNCIVCIDSEIYTAITLANISVTNKHEGVGKTVLEIIHSFHTKQVFTVECVHAEELYQHLSKQEHWREYDLINRNFCRFKG